MSVSIIFSYIFPVFVQTNAHPDQIYKETVQSSYKMKKIRFFFVTENINDLENEYWLLKVLELKQRAFSS